jgi:hypothetical protein
LQPSHDEVRLLSHAAQSTVLELAHSAGLFIPQFLTPRTRYAKENRGDAGRRSYLNHTPELKLPVWRRRCPHTEKPGESHQQGPAGHKHYDPIPPDFFFSLPVCTTMVSSSLSPICSATKIDGPAPSVVVMIKQGSDQGFIYPIRRIQGRTSQAELEKNTAAVMEVRICGGVCYEGDGRSF